MLADTEINSLGAPLSDLEMRKVNSERNSQNVNSDKIMLGAWSRLLLNLITRSHNLSYIF